MDPYVEDQALWPDFHHELVEVLFQILTPGMLARYKMVKRNRTHAATARPEEFIEIHEKADDNLVTLMDVVSPANKTTPAGREEYLRQRRMAKESQANIVEIDVVLQGKPTLDYNRDGLPKWKYAVTVTRASQPDRYEIYTATLDKRLPRFRLPLAADDRDSVIDLNVAFGRCFEKGGFFERIDYCREPAVPLDDEDRAWLDAHLIAQQLRKPLPSHEEIALAAYTIWEQEGRPEGRHQAHWAKAVEQLRRKS
jgi:hypothetical protein